MIIRYYGQFKHKKLCFSLSKENKICSLVCEKKEITKYFGGIENLFFFLRQTENILTVPSKGAPSKLA